MTEILNQQAIDNLFEARSRAPGQKGLETRPYNFRQPFRLGPAAQRSLESIQATFVQGLRRVLAVQLRMPIEVAVTATEMVDLPEFVLSLGTPNAAYQFPVGKHEEAWGVFDWGMETAFAAVDRLLGGNGAPVNLVRPLTPIEEGIVRLLTERALPPFAAAWKESIAIGHHLKPFEAAPITAAGGQPDNRVLATLLRVRTEHLDGTITIGLPWSPLEKVLDQRPAGRRRTTSRVHLSDTAVRRLAESDLRHSHLVLSARLPPALLPFEALRGLKPGQVLDMAHAMDTAVQLHVNGRVLFNGSLGQSRGHVVVKVDEKVSRPAPERLAYSRKGRVI